jgi:hypothetical protein
MAGYFPFHAALKIELACSNTEELSCLASV